MNNNDAVVFVHLSDLHFSKNKYEKKKFHSHSVPLLRGVENEIKKMAYDRLIITGDISNRGDRDSLELAHEWIFKKIGIDEGKKLLD